MNINSATNNFLDAMNSVPRFKKALELLVFKNQSILKKLLKKFINKKDPQIKTVFHEQYKTYRNLLSPLMKQSKQIYHKKCFNNWNNISNTWEGIKTIISIKNITTTVCHSIEFNNRTIADPTAMSDVFILHFYS